MISPCRRASTGPDRGAARPAQAGGRKRSLPGRRRGGQGLLAESVDDALGGTMVRLREDVSSGSSARSSCAVSDGPRSKARRSTRSAISSSRTSHMGGFPRPGRAEKHRAGSRMDRVTRAAPTITRRCWRTTISRPWRSPRRPGSRPNHWWSPRAVRCAMQVTGRRRSTPSDPPSAFTMPRSSSGRRTAWSARSFSTGERSPPATT